MSSMYASREGVQTNATVTVAATQMLWNGDFENNVSGWNYKTGTSWKSATLEQFTFGEFPSGLACLRVTYGSGTKKVGIYTVAEPLTVGQQYIFSGWINVPYGYPDIYLGKIDGGTGRAKCVEKLGWLPFMTTWVADTTSAQIGFETVTSTSGEDIGLYVDGLVLTTPAEIVVDGATVPCIAYVLNGETYAYSQRVTVTLRNPYPPLIQGVERS